jgi:hypothetical protein
LSLAELVNKLAKQDGMEVEDDVQVTMQTWM